MHSRCAATRPRLVHTALCAVLMALLVALLSSSSAAAPAVASGAVIAIMGESPGLNVLHDDFRTADGRDPTYPSAMPKPVFVSIPTRGTFAQRMAILAAGPLGHAQPGVLYAVHGTRLLLYATPGVTDLVGGDRLHATGVTSAAVGRHYGTSPASLAVFVPTATPAAFAWLDAQPWVDVASVSTYTIRRVNSSDPPGTPVCLGARPVRDWISRGHVFFASSGNTTDEPEPAISPNGLAEVYQVGGVDASGRTWLPGHSEESDPFYADGTVVRPYQTGELFSFEAAAPDALTGGIHFGGTSGATPRTAGRAAQLIELARSLLGGSRAGTSLAVRRGARSLPSTGPLADGRLSAPELVALLHETARPFEPAVPGRYALEGYGALNKGTQATAGRVLAGSSTLPSRSYDDAANDAVQALRAAAVDDRCP